MNNFVYYDRAPINRPEGSFAKNAYFYKLLTLEEASDRNIHLSSNYFYVFSDDLNGMVYPIVKNSTFANDMKPVKDPSLIHILKLLFSGNLLK